VAGAGGGIRPGHGRSAGGGLGRIAEGNEHRLVSRAASADKGRLGNRVMPEHRLDSDGRSRHPVADHGIAPQAKLAALVGDKLIGHQSQQADPADGDPFVMLARTLGRLPAVKLPAHPLGHGKLGQQPVVPPQPGDLLAVVADHLDLNPDAGQTARGKLSMHLAGHGFGGEHNPLGLLDRRVELDLDGQVRRRRTGGERSGIEPAGQPVREQAGGPEPVSRLGRRHGGELPQRPDSEPDQQVGKVGLAEDGDRARG